MTASTRLLVNSVQSGMGRHCFEAINGCASTMNPGGLKGETRSASEARLDALSPITTNANTADAQATPAAAATHAAPFHSRRRAIRRLKRRAQMTIAPPTSEPS